jgi:hypothetical protein
MLSGADFCPESIASGGICAERVVQKQKEPANRPQCSNYLLCGAVELFAKGSPFRVFMQKNE